MPFVRILGRGASRHLTWIVGLAAALATLTAVRSAGAGTVAGKIDLPAGTAGELPVRTRGFLDRIANPHLPVRAADPLPLMVVALVGGEVGAPPPPITWELVGESFARPLLPVVAGASVAIKNRGKGAPVLRATEAPALIPPGPINPNGAKEIKIEGGPLFTITTSDSPSVLGRIAVMPSRYFAAPDASGRFEIADVPPGKYVVRVWYQTGWLDRRDEEIQVDRRADINPAIPAGLPIAGAR